MEIIIYVEPYNHFSIRSDIIDELEKMNVSHNEIGELERGYLDDYKKARTDSRVITIIKNLINNHYYYESNYKILTIPDNAYWVVLGGGDDCETGEFVMYSMTPFFIEKGE